MLVLVHGLHVGLILVGIAATVAILEPSLSRGGRIRRLRAAAQAGTLVELAMVRARHSSRVPRSLAVLNAFSFAAASVTAAVVAALLAGTRHLEVLAVGSALVVLLAMGVWVFGRVRRPWVISACAVAVQVVLHPLLVVSAQLATLGHVGSLTRAFADALICHRVDVAPSPAQVRAFAAQFGISTPHASSSATAAFLSPLAMSAVAGLAIGCALFAGALGRLSFAGAAASAARG